MCMNIEWECISCVSNLKEIKCSTAIFFASSNHKLMQQCLQIKTRKKKVYSMHYISIATNKFKVCIFLGWKKKIKEKFDALFSKKLQLQKCKASTLKDENLIKFSCNF